MGGIIVRGFDSSVCEIGVVFVVCSCSFCFFLVGGEGRSEIAGVFTFSLKYDFQSYIISYII